MYWNLFPFLEPNSCFEKNETRFQENATRFSKMELRSITFLFVTDFVEYPFPRLLLIVVLFMCDHAHVRIITSRDLKMKLIKDLRT